MKLPIRKEILFACLGLLGAGIFLRVGLDAVDGYADLMRRKEQLGQKLGHLKGWASVSAQTEQQVETMFGAPAESEGILEDLNRRARALGLKISEMKPSDRSAEIALEGTSTQIGSYLQGLAEQRPPLRLESIQILSQPKSDAPVSMRLRVQWVVPEIR